MKLPCIDCKFKKETKVVFRTYVGCSDEKKKADNFHYDDYFYRHSCDAYEEEGGNEHG